MQVERYLRPSPVPKRRLAEVARIERAAILVQEEADLPAYLYEEND